MCAAVNSYCFISPKNNCFSAVPLSLPIDTSQDPLNDQAQRVAQSCDEITPCTLPPTLLFQNKGMFLRLALPIYVFSTESLHIVSKSPLACVCLGLRGYVCGWCRPWIQLCLSERCLAVTEGKPEPREGQQRPRDPANRKLTQTLIHLPNIHSLEISVLFRFFIEVSLLI